METFWIQLSAISPIDWIAMASGIAGVWLSIKERLLAWPLFILCYAAYVYISFRGNYYAFGGMNIIFVGVASYGWLKWASPGKEAEDRLAVSHVAPGLWPIIGLLILTGTVGIGWLLSTTGEARLPYFDAFATSSALVAQWMLSRKHIESWAFWIASDCIYLGFFFKDRVWPSVLLFAVFMNLAVKGWREWNAIIKKTKRATEACNASS